MKKLPTFTLGTLSILMMGLLIFSNSAATAQVSTDTIIPSQTSSEGPTLFKVLNYNTIEQGQNEEWIEIVKAENPDIFIQVETGFIENLEPWKEELNAYFEDEEPYEVAGFDGTSGTDGQAIYSRYPIESTNVLYEVTLDDGTTHNMNHPYMEALINIDGLEVYFFANHLSCCTSFDTRMLEQEGLMNYFDQLGDVPIVYGGDFNSDSPEDVGDIAPLQGSLGIEPVEMMVNASFPTAPENHIFTDTYRTLNPDRKGYTLNHRGNWESIDHFRGRIDYIFVNQHLNDYMVNSSVVTEADYPEVITASDHKPMYTWFNFDANEIDLQPPLNPQNLRIDTTTTSSATLSWDAVDAPDLFKYSIYRNGSLLSDISGDITTFTDDYQYNSDTVYIYEVTATDEVGNEGRFSLPAITDTANGELFAPYQVETNTYANGGSTGVNWTISGTSGLDLVFANLYIAVDLEDTFIIRTTINQPGISGNALISIDPVVDIKVKMTVANAIGESDLTPAAYISYSGDDTVGDLQPDRSNTFQYGHFLSNMMSDIAIPEATISLPDLSDTETDSSTTTTPSSSSDNEDTSYLGFLSSIVTLVVIPILRVRNKNN